MPRGVGSYLNLGGQLVMWGNNLPLLVDLGLTDLPKPGWLIARSIHVPPTSLKPIFFPPNIQIAMILTIKIGIFFFHFSSRDEKSASKKNNTLLYFSNTGHSNETLCLY